VATNGRVSFRRFVKEVGKYGPTALLPEIARIGSHQALRHREGGERYFDVRRPETPWALVEVARECIVHGVETGRPASVDDVARLCSLYVHLEDPLSESSNASIDQFLVRVGFEQFRWGISEFEEISRSRALLVEAAAHVPTAASAFSDAAWQEVLGCSVAEFIDVGFFLYVWAAQHEGWVDLGYLDLPHFGPVLDLYPRERVMDVLERRLAATPAQLRSMDSKATVPDNVKEHRFNPLNARPLVRMRDGRLLAPHPLLILHRLGVSGLYYDRVHDSGFTDQLGLVLESYVGMNLSLVAGAQVHCNPDLGRDGKSVDFIVVLSEVTLLVEVKATRLTELARAGLDRLHEDRERTIDKAYAQIERAHRLVLGGHERLSFVPTDRPFRGLVVTLEAYWLATSGFAPTRSGSVHTNVVSLRELEQFCAAAQTLDVNAVLLDLPSEHSNQVLAHAVRDHRCKNPILQRNWNATLVGGTS
jgi:hypothetical protein